MKSPEELKEANNQASRRELAQLNERVHELEDILGIPVSQDSDDHAYLHRRLRNLIHQASLSIAAEDVSINRQPVYPYA